MNRELLHAYFDGECTDEERAAVESALRSDPAAAAELETLRRLDGSLEVLAGATAPADLERRVRLRLRRRGLLLRILAPAALAAAAAAAVFAFLLPSQAPSTAGAPEVFTTKDYLSYVWESDADTYAPLDVGTMKDEVLRRLGTGS